MARQLRDVGENISNIKLIAKVLNSLPVKFDLSRHGIDANNQTLENLTHRLIKEEEKMNAIEMSSVP